MAADLPHRLRTPLTALRAEAQLARARPGPGRGRGLACGELVEQEIDAIIRAAAPARA